MSERKFGCIRFEALGVRAVALIAHHPLATHDPLSVCTDVLDDLRWQDLSVCVMQGAVTKADLGKKIAISSKVVKRKISKAFKVRACPPPRSISPFHLPLCTISCGGR